jgi:hypothetical protein
MIGTKFVMTSCSVFMWFIGFDWKGFQHLGLIIAAVK